MNTARGFLTFAVWLFGGLLLLVWVPVVAEGTIQEGDTVAIEFVLKLDDGTTVDGNEGGEPFVFVMGDADVLPSLQAALEGRTAGDDLNVRLNPEEAYGERDTDRLQEVPADIIPEESRQVGAWLDGRNAEGRAFRVRVHEVGDDWVVLDGNHPLAGEPLNFHVKILSVEPGGAD